MASALLDSVESLSHASVEVASDARPAEAQHEPSIGSGSGVEARVVLDGGRPRMPVVAIRLHDDTRFVEDEIRLPSTEHRAVHREDDAGCHESIMQHLLDARHLGREPLAHARVSNLCAPRLRRRESRSRRVKLGASSLRVAGGARLQRGDDLRSRGRVAPEVASTTVTSAEDGSGLLQQSVRGDGHRYATSTARHFDALATEAKRRAAEQGAERRGSTRPLMLAEARSTFRTRGEAAIVAVAIGRARRVEGRSALQAIATHPDGINQSTDERKEAAHGA